MKTRVTTSYDIAIVGGGPAGLCFARAVANSGLSVAVIERQPETVLVEPPYDGREIALTHLSQRIMRELGIWDLIPSAHISLIRHAKVLNGDSDYTLHFDYKETGRENLGFMVSNHRIRKAAYDSLSGQKNIHLLTGHEVSDVKMGAQGCALTLSGGQAIECRLVVAADSRFSALRKILDIPTDMLDFKRTCIVCKMSVEKSHEYTAYECFHYDRTLAVLPLNNNEVSIVITLDSDKKGDVLDVSPEDFAADMESRTEERFGKMALSTKLYPYPLISTYAKRFYGPRCALIGDAAVGMHPVTAHGFNLGLRGGHTLAGLVKEAVSTGLDIGSAALLQRYNRAHRNASRPIYLGTNALVKLYTRDTPPARLARGLLLRLGNRIRPAKRMIQGQLTEIAGTDAA